MRFEEFSPEERRSSPLRDLGDVARAHLNHILQNRERYLEAWIASTGINPEDAVLVETVDLETHSLRIQVVPKTEQDRRIAALMAQESVEEFLKVAQELETLAKRILDKCREVK